MNEFQVVRDVLSVHRRAGETDFDKAWYSALRHLVPPDGAPDDAVVAHEDLKPILREEKARWRAAYEGRIASDEELRDGQRAAERRLRDLIDYTDQT